MSAPKIEIFEIKGSEESELSTSIEMLMIDVHKKTDGGIMFRKINVLNKDSMKGQSDISKMLRDEGMEILPLVKLNGKVISVDKLEQFLRKHLL